MPDDGSAELLQILDGDPETYQAWAEDYYDCEVPLAAVRAIYDHTLLSVELIATLNPTLTLAELRGSAAEISYPSN